MVEAAPTSCPKCGAPRRDEPACPRCGIRAERMEAFARARDAEVPPSVIAAWERVDAAWDEAAAHDALFSLTAQHACYAWTAARYRDARDGQGAVRTDPHLARVRRAAEATLLAGATRPRDKERTPYRSAMMVLALLVIMIVVGLMLAMVQRGSDTPAPPAPQVR